MILNHEVPYSLKFIAVPLKDGQLSITAQIILHRQKSQMATGLRCCESEWDSQMGNFNPATPHLKYQINRLAEFEGKVYDCYVALRNSFQKPTAASIKKLITGKDESHSQLLLGFMDEYSDLVEKRGEYCTATISRYRKVRKYMSTYLGKKGLKNLPLSEFKRAHLVGFQNFLLTTRNPLLKKPISRVTSNTYIKKLHVVINEAIALELIEHDPFIGFKLENVKVAKEFLTLDELSLLSNYKFEKPHHRNVAKVYLFCAACGLRFSDAMALKRENITVNSNGEYWLTIQQMKTKVPLSVPMFRSAVGILEHYKQEYPEMETVLPTITNQFANRTLKQIAKLVGIQKHLKFHSSRHTFACSLIQRGADLFATSKLMGHTSVSSTEIYAKMSSSRVLEVVKQLEGDL